jgi:hypothetical protein
MGTVFDLLDGEWRKLADDTTMARKLHDVCRAAGGATTLRDVEGYVRSAAHEDADRVLVALVRRAVAGDDLSARVLLQLLLPGTRNLARRWWALGDTDERAAAAVAAVYQRIRCYPIDRRPGKVAANILMDAARELRRAVGNLDRCIPSAETMEREQAPLHDPDPAGELADTLLEAVGNGTITSGDAQLIAQSRIGGTRIAAIAAHRGASTRTLWARRQRAERALARATAEAC